MAKFLPVFGEVFTAVESGGKLIAAGVTAPFNPEAGKQLLDSAGQAWVDYTKQNVIACTVRGDREGVGRGADEFSKGFPVVAHVRSGVHLLKGECEEAYDCFANGTKAIGMIAAVSAATVATGGMAAAPALAIVGGAAAGTQVAADGVDTALRSVAVGEFRAAGTIQGVQRAAKTGRAVDIADAVLAPVQTAVACAGAAGAHRAWTTYRHTAALKENLAGTGQSLEAPQPTANPGLTADALSRVPDGPRLRMPRAAPEPSAAPSSAPSKATSAVATGLRGAPSELTTSGLTDVVEQPAFSRSFQQQALNENPVNFLDGKGRPTKSVQHSFNRHVHDNGQPNQPPKLNSLPDGFPKNWSKFAGTRFVQWLHEVVNHPRTVMYKLTYRGEAGHRLFYNSTTGNSVIVKVSPTGNMDFAAAFPLSPAQLKHAMLGRLGNVH